MIINSFQSKALFRLLTFALLAFLPINHLHSATIDNTFTIANTSNREFAAGLAFDGTNFLVGIQGDATAYDSIVAQLVSPSGTLVGSLITTGHLGDVPMIGFDGTNYLMVWQDCGEPCIDDLFGMFVSPGGSNVGPVFNISGTIEEIGGLASDGSDYLIVYFKEVNPDTSDSKVYGRLVSTAGTVGAEITISAGFGDFGVNNVAFDGTNYLVVWVDDDNDTEIRGRFVSSTGTLGTEFSINASSFHSDNLVTVIFDGTNYLVVWEDQVGGYPDGEWDLFAQRLDTSGNAMGGVIPVSTATGSQHFPLVAFDGNSFLVTWTDMRNDLNENFTCDGGEGTCWDIRGQFLSQSGDLVGSEFAINEDPGNQFGSPVSFGGSKYLVVWTSGDGRDGAVGDVFGATISETVVPDGATYRRLTNPRRVVPVSGSNTVTTQNRASPRQ